MLDLTMGANAPITDDRGDLVLEWPGAAGSLDCSAFLLSPLGRVRSDADMVFYNQPEGGGGAVGLVSGETTGTARFALDLRRVPGDVERIVVCATVDGDRTIEAFAGLKASFGRRPDAMRFVPDLRGAREAALRIVEFYRRGGGWKIRADGQGYNGGLGPLARSFGVDVEGDEAAGSTVPAPGGPAPGDDARASDGLRAGAVDRERPIVFDVPPLDEAVPPRSSMRPAGAAVLRRGETRRLTLSAADAGVVRAALTWSSRQGGADGRVRPLRLKLGAFYEMRDGRRGALQEPDARQVPEGDDLLALAPSDRNDGDEAAVVVRAAGLSGLVRIDLYAFVDGPPSWRSSQVELLITMPGSTPTAIEVPTPDDGCSCILLATLRSDESGISLECLVRGAADQRSLDAERDWNLRWRTPDRS